MECCQTSGWNVTLPECYLNHAHQFELSLCVCQIHFLLYISNFLGRKIFEDGQDTGDDPCPAEEGADCGDPEPAEVSFPD